MLLGFWACRPIPSLLPTALGAPFMVPANLWSALHSPRAQTLPPGKPYLAAPLPGPICPETPSWKQPPSLAHLQPCWSSCSGGGPSASGSQGSLHLPSWGRPAEWTQPWPPSFDLCPSLGTPVSYFYFSPSLALVVFLPPPKSLLFVLPPVSLSELRAAPTSPHSSGSGSGRFLPGQCWTQLMIPLIFSVSTGDQPATPAA